MPSLAQAQVDADRARLARQRPLLLRKWRRMAASPFAFLRGASGLWAEALARHPEWLRTAPGVGGLVGDLHLENFGTFRAASGMTFHVNDFDESFDGPWTFDVLRLLVSTLLARPELRCTGTQVLHLAHAVLDGHEAGLAQEKVPRPAFIQHLVDEAEAERPTRLLEKRLDDAGKLERNEEKYPEAPATICRAVPAALTQWCGFLDDACGEPLVSCQAAPPKGQKQRPPDALEVVDVTRRVAGTGSLGVERLQVLSKGDGQRWLLEVKALRGSPASKREADAAQVVQRLRRALPQPPLGLGAARLNGLQVLIHPLFPGEDKLSVEQLEPDALEPTLRYLGFLSGEVHRRAARQSARWNKGQQAAVLDAAGELAGLHAQAFLEFCRLVVDDLEAVK
ncbi:MAG: DUF2252 family protein [Myxococcales bacterium]|nr:DUF2252 family protein [Myxococcales bacterium]